MAPEYETSESVGTMKSSSSPETTDLLELLAALRDLAVGIIA
jgi:hypothetical protein